MINFRKVVAAQPQQAAAPMAWRFIGLAGCKPYLTQKQYEAQTTGMQQWYEPFRCAACAQPEQAVPEWPCTCDERGIGEPGVSCGDCPRDYGHKVQPQQAAQIKQRVEPVKADPLSELAERLPGVRNDSVPQPQQATDLDALKRDNDKLRTVMIAAAEEIHAHWDAHCDSEGYGPVNLMHRLEEGIPSEYGYTAGAFAALKAAQSAAVDSAVAAERERCAALCETWNTSPGSRLAKEIRGAAAQPQQAVALRRRNRMADRAPRGRTHAVVERRVLPR